MKKYTAYHFSRNDDRLGYGDGREIVLGETLSVEDEPELCEYGLHGSIRLVDALGYASGSHLWLVEIWGSVKVGEDKICGKHRKAVIRCGDVLPLIVEFAYWCAGRAAEYAAKSAAKYAANYAEYAANYAEYAANYAAKSAAKYAAKYAANYAFSAANCAANYAFSAANCAAKHAVEERRAQDAWWENKLSRINDGNHRR